MTSSTSTNDVLLNTDLPDLDLYASGKVRDIYRIDNDHLLFIATDRISAFDYVLATGIPQKGRVLTQLSLFWFDFLKDIVPNHLATADVRQYPHELQKYTPQLRGRSMMVVRADMITIECVVRGYLSGSGWKEYKANGEVCGIPLPKGLRESDKLPEPIFTPAIKASSGHDENIPFDRMVELAGRELSEQLRDLSIKIYQTAADYAETRGIIIADTKFEFGRTPRGLVLADEVLDTGFVALLAEGQVQSQAAHRSLSTSSTSATTWKRLSGTSSRRHRPCRRKWLRRRARSTLKRIPSSPGVRCLGKLSS